MRSYGRQGGGVLGFFFHLLKAKLVFLGGANIPVIAALLVLGTTGVVVTGTIKGDEDGDDRRRATFDPAPHERMHRRPALLVEAENLLAADAHAAGANRHDPRILGAARVPAPEHDTELGA